MTASLGGDCRGIAAVEFAMTSSISLMLLLGTIEIGRMMSAQHALNLGVDRAVRYAVVHGSNSSSPVTPGSPTPVSNTFTATATPLLGSAVSTCHVTVTYASNSNAPGSQVTVSVTYAWKPIAPITHLPSMTLSASSVGTIQN